MWLAIAHRSPSLIIHPLISSFSLFPSCLSVFTACHFIHPCTCHQPHALRMKWWGALREEERQSNLTPSLCIFEAPWTRATQGKNRGHGEMLPEKLQCFKKTHADLLQSAWVTAAHCNSLSLAHSVQLFIICYFCSFPPAQRCSFMELCVYFFHLWYASFISTLSLSIHFAACHNTFFSDLWLCVLQALTH